MDYDTTEIPLVYDRARDHGPEHLQLWMNVVSACVGKQPVTRILDLGCGTGRFTEALAAHFDAEVVGVDPSTKMLDQARKKRRDPRVQYQAGSGEAIPLADGSVDLVFMSMCFHHFTDQKAAARECRRVGQVLQGFITVPGWGFPAARTRTTLILAPFGSNPALMICERRFGLLSRFMVM